MICCGRLYAVPSDAGAFQVGADLGLLVFPFLEFLGAVLFLHDLALGFWRDPRVVGEIDLSGLVKVGVVGRRSVLGNLPDRTHALDAELDAVGIFHGDVEGAQN